MTESSKPPAISVLIRTFNSAKTLDRVLCGLTLKSDEEYIVVDSGSTDSTLAIAGSRGARIVHATGPFNYSKSLNLGFQAARNPWVLVISSHSAPVVPDLLAEFRSAAEQFPLDVVVGYAPNSLDGRSPIRDDKIRYYNREDMADIYPFCGNGNTLYRRPGWEITPFDESIRTGEDKAWLTEMIGKGYRIAFVPRARTINISRYSLRYMFKKGYSDCRALPHEPRTLRDLVMGLGSHTKRFLQGGMPVGNWVRYGAHIAGQYFGSQKSQDNTPEN
jgi:glycosyltransferase involved in cell wall biosynthesis